MPPNISQRIGPPRNAGVTLNEAVPIETIGRNRCQELPPGSRFLQTPGPQRW
jgi:hypothetical protein